MSENIDVKEMKESAIQFVVGENVLLKFAKDKASVRGVETEDGKEIVSAFREWMQSMKQTISNWNEAHLAPENSTSLKESTFTLEETGPEIFRISPNGDIYFKGVLVENDLALVTDFNFYTANMNSFL